MMNSMGELSIDEIASVSGGDPVTPCLGAAQLGSQIGAGVGFVAGFIYGSSGGWSGVFADATLGAIGGFMAGGLIGLAGCMAWNAGASLYDKIF